MAALITVDNDVVTFLVDMFNISKRHLCHIGSRSCDSCKLQ